MMFQLWEHMTVPRHQIRVFLGCWKYFWLRNCMPLKLIFWLPSLYLHAYFSHFFLFIPLSPSFFFSLSIPPSWTPLNTFSSCLQYFSWSDSHWAVSVLVIIHWKRRRVKRLGNKQARAWTERKNHEKLHQTRQCPRGYSSRKPSRYSSVSIPN
jgi:hypothetical protein